MDKAHVQIGSIGPGFESCREAAFFPPLRFTTDHTKAAVENILHSVRDDIKYLSIIIVGPETLWVLVRGKTSCPLAT